LENQKGYKALTALGTAPELVFREVLLLILSGVKNNL
jgi:hypothetical protein